MSSGNSRRLANLKTKSESGFDYILSGLEIETPFGKKALKENRTFFPGEEEELKEELDKVESLLQFAEKEKKTLGILSEQFMCIKDIETFNNMLNLF